MIPKDLKEFRDLMRVVAQVIDEDGWPVNTMAPQLRALSTATPEQIMGMVGEVETRRAWNDIAYIVVPRGEETT